MITVLELEIGRHGLNLSIPHYGDVRLGSTPPSDPSKLWSVNVAIGCKTIELLGFSRGIISANPAESTYSAWLHCAYGDDQAPFFALIGLLKVAFIQSGNELSLREFDLDRRIDDDWGAYRTDILPGPNGFVLAYEAGVVCFNFSGAVEWEHPTSPHDYLDSISDRTLRFKSDKLSKHGFGIWNIDMTTGRIASGSTEE